jgi:hypothetical protein
MDRRCWCCHTCRYVDISDSIYPDRYAVLVQEQGLIKVCVCVCVCVRVCVCARARVCDPRTPCCDAMSLRVTVWRDAGGSVRPSRLCDHHSCGCCTTATEDCCCCQSRRHTHGTQESDILLFFKQVHKLQPGFFVALDRPNKKLLWVIRGAFRQLACGQPAACFCWLSTPSVMLLHT